MGDMLSLIEKVEENIDQKQAEEMQRNPDPSAPLAEAGSAGTLKIISPGRARPISSRAMRSMIRGSLLSAPT